MFIYGFLPLALVGFYSTARFGRRPAIFWLIVASFVFYGWWNPAFVPLLIISIAFNYSLSCVLASQALGQIMRLWLLRGAVGANLLALIYYKYIIWLIGLVTAIGFVELQTPSIILPLGISFFTFTQIGYLFDCYHGEAKDRDPLNYIVFVTFFPHLIAGPILHNGEIMPQFADARMYRFSPTNFATGLAMFVMGLLKKCLLADPTGTIVAFGYGHPEALGIAAAWHTVLSYSLQLYFDFSGYSDMALGLALMFNIRFPLNFNSPYKAESVVDYWQRWHMTLTRYFNQYLYNPIAMAAMRGRMRRRLPVNRGGQLTVRGFMSMVAVPIFVTIGLAGVWHGAGAQYLVFGLLHATFMSINRLYRIIFPAVRKHDRLSVIGRVALTYACVLVASVFFRAPSVLAALSMLAGLFGAHGNDLVLPLPAVLATALGMPHVVQAVSWQAAAHAWYGVAWIVALYGIIWAMPNTQQILAAFRPALDEVTPSTFRILRWELTPRWALAMGCATTLALVAIGGTGEFLYFQF